jgi:hypothetical protein
VQVLDANGRGVGGQKLDFLTSAGSVGPAQDMGDGTYVATYTVPAGTTGEVKISVATADGAASSFTRLPIGGADGAWGANPFASAQSAATPFGAQPAAQPVAAQPAPVQPVAAPPAPVQPTPTAGAATTTTQVTPVTSGRPWLRAQRCADAATRWVAEGTIGKGAYGVVWCVARTPRL